MTKNYGNLELSFSMLKLLFSMLKLVYISQIFSIPSDHKNFTIKSTVFSNSYKVAMYSVIMDVNGEELRSKIVEESYNAPPNNGNYVTIKINFTTTL